MPNYVVDTNFFIQAHRSSYPLDIAHSFWRKVKELADTEKMISIDKVRDEIFENEDELTEWVKDNISSSFFKDSRDKSVIAEYRKVAQWAESRSGHYKRKAIDEFLEFEKADAWLVAYCLVTGDEIVTQEVSDPNRKNKIKIPDVCNHFGVPFLNMMDMFRQLGVQF